MFSLGPCENCKRQGMRGGKIRSAEMFPRSSHQQFSGRSDRSVPVIRSSEQTAQSWTNQHDQHKRLQSRYHDIVHNRNKQGKSGYYTTSKHETHHFHGGSFQVNRHTEQRASLSSRSGPRYFVDKPLEYPKEIRTNYDQSRPETSERQFRLSWDRIKDNNNADVNQQLDSRDRLGSRVGLRMDNTERLGSRSGQRLDSTERLGSRGGQRTWFDNEHRYISSQGSERRFNLWSRPSTRERITTPSEGSAKLSRRRVHLVDSPQYITESRLEKMEQRNVFPPIPNDNIKSILKRGKPKCVIVVHGTG